MPDNWGFATYEYGVMFATYVGADADKSDLPATIDSVAEKISGFLNDYTTDRRGDVGSSSRLEAIEAVKLILELKLTSDCRPPCFEIMIGHIVRLAAEKPDKVRFQAWRCLQTFWESSAEFPPLKRYNVSAPGWYGIYLTVIQKIRTF
jgi:hypothetical protein